MEVILANSGARGFYFTLEPRLFSGNNWSPAARATMVALCCLAAESNAIGVFRLHVSDVKMVLESFSFHGKTTTVPSIWRAIRELEQNNSITIHKDSHIFIHGFWSYRGTPTNRKHRDGAERVLASMPPELQEKFRCHYGLNSIGNQQANGIANAIHQEQEQYQEQYQLRELKANPLPAAAEPPVDLTETERLVLQEMKDGWGPLGYVLDYGKAVKTIRTVAVDFPRADLLETAKKMTLWMGDQRSKTKNFMLRYRNFCENANNRPQRFNQDGSTNGYHGNGKYVPTAEEIERRVVGGGSKDW